MTHAYSEDQLVEQPAIGLFATLGWQMVSALEEVFGSGGTLGRETKGEVVLLPRLLSGQVVVDAISGAISDSPACPPQLHFY